MCFQLPESKASISAASPDSTAPRKPKQSPEVENPKCPLLPAMNRRWSVRHHKTAFRSISTRRNPDVRRDPLRQRSPRFFHVGARRHRRETCRPTIDFSDASTDRRPLCQPQPPRRCGPGRQSADRAPDQIGQRADLFFFFCADNRRRAESSAAQRSHGCLACASAQTRSNRSQIIIQSGCCDRSRQRSARHHRVNLLTGAFTLASPKASLRSRNSRARPHPVGHDQIFRSGFPPVDNRLMSFSSSASLTTPSCYRGRRDRQPSDILYRRPPGRAAVFVRTYSPNDMPKRARTAFLKHRLLVRGTGGLMKDAGIFCSRNATQSRPIFVPRGSFWAPRAHCDFLKFGEYFRLASYLARYQSDNRLVMGCRVYGDFR